MLILLRLASILLFLSFIACSPLETRGLGSRLLRGVKATLFSGAGTFYEVGSGSCGEYDTDDMLVVAVNKAQMQNGPNPNNNPLCQNTVFITGNRGSTSARVVDTCPACPQGALDMSPKVFELVCGSLSAGVCTISWSFT
ncbi:uncharacterized protein EV154DRAFT_471911 [Mucor mucedo]|uniref:RlpA-like protein double-psi beta-barrel domain-containing protein n=1 Tax=Mucor saturninus TaxID=64648 RepID=A0A8H7V5H2_9FUNG|nr:uncharacterized protein EV154DRAFT_471911 [Mucor mucedo]KAG2204143.1 hypothetical protein INT47_011626 [Mucor saturninus]KAI7879537.1 hypothetical protein EV154DRAFT_471911 [Mucor mucedo]